MVARGNNRNNGANLGVAALNANNALSNSNGNNWRSRPTFGVMGFPWHNVSGSEPETPHKTACSCHWRDVVKNVHERPVSRLSERIIRTVVAQKGQVGGRVQ